MNITRTNGVRSALEIGSGAHHSLSRLGCDKVVSEQFVLGVVCKVVSSKVLFMGVKPATFINRRLQGI